MVWRTREFDHNRIEIIKSAKVTNSLPSNTYVSDIVFNMSTFVSRKSSVKSVNSVQTSEGKSDYCLYMMPLFVATSAAGNARRLL